MSLNIEKYTISAIFVALAYVLSFIRVIHLPFGGSVTLLSMLVISLPSHLLGVKYGFIASFAYSLLQLIVDPYVVHPVQLILDYTVAFSCFGIVGLFGKRDKSLAIGYIVACCIRFISSSISGYVFFKEFAPEGWNPLVYTVVYNASYIFSECIISLIVIYILSDCGVLKYFRSMIYNKEM